MEGGRKALFRPLFGGADVPDVARDYRNPLRPAPRVRRPRPTR
jgi:hypothetical protein